MTNIKELPERCKKCPYGAFNDFWCIWAESQCYKDSIAIDRYNENDRMRSKKE